MDHKQDKHTSWRERILDALLRQPKDKNDLIHILNDAKDNQLLDKDALDMIAGVLEVSEMQARDIMIPKPKMIVIEDSMTVTLALPIIIDSGHSRYPVTEEGSDKIIGVMLAKDLLKYALQEKNLDSHIKEIVRPIIFSPESKRLDALLKEFKQKHNHMAIVIDEYGHVAGLITIEDILEQIVGDIEDEFDEQQEPDIKPVDDNAYLVKALTDIEDFNQFFNCDFSDNDADTIGGLVLREFSHLPKQGEIIKMPPFEIKIVEATKRGIQLLRVMKHKEL
ncbi:MAG: CBS domain-containing protein [Gammaproteobacteria bacterium]|nr:CBS domain-containing protein [Gammaproteobacteria bacterium]